jgi:hypothetical protein
MNNQSSKKIRVTVIVPEALDQNVEAYALGARLQKSEVVTLALTQFLQKHGIPHPEIPPNIMKALKARVAGTY